MKVAIVHDWLPVMGGAEKVLKELVAIFPGADIFTLFDFLSDDDRKSLGGAKITTSYLNRLPGVKKYYRKLLPFCPQAIEDFDLEGYDLIISSSHTVAKGVITSPKQTHISYVHTPTRYAWDMMHRYLREDGLDRGIKGYLAKYLLHRFRIWDCRTANGVDHFIANSDFIRQRIWKVYRREADVIYPPVDTQEFQVRTDKDDFFFASSRMVPYKRIPLIVEAFAKLPDQKLVVIGDGPDMEKAKEAAKDATNITIMGYQPNAVLKDHMQRARAFVFAAEEDFGIMPVEAQACGTPVIAFGAGGALETVIDIRSNASKGTGIFFNEQTPESLIQAVREFNALYTRITSANCRANAENFSVATFKKNILSMIEKIQNKTPFKKAV